MSAPLLVLGGGLTGMLAAAELAEAGAEAIVLERGPILGGKRAARLLNGEGIDHRLSAIESLTGVDCLTLAELHSVDGEAGAFTVIISEQPRYVTADCTRCNHCVPVCPQAVPNEYDAGLTLRKAIHSPLPTTIPNIYTIDINACLNSPPNYLPCQRCVEVCDDQAIDFNMPVAPTRTCTVAAIIVATGYADASDEERGNLAEFGYGTHPDIVSTVELQRLLEDPGPSGGFAVRVSDENYPEAVLLVLTAITPEACWVMVNQLAHLHEQDVGRIEVLVLAADSEDSALEQLRIKVVECGAKLHFGSWIDVTESQAGILSVSYADLPSGQRIETEVELIVLSSEVRPDQHIGELAEILDLSLDSRGYPVASRPGIYLAGGAQGTVGIEAGAQQARAAVQHALGHLRRGGDESATTQPLENLSKALLHQGDDLQAVLYALMKIGRDTRK